MPKKSGTSGHSPADVAARDAAERADRTSVATGVGVGIPLVSEGARDASGLGVPVAAEGALEALVRGENGDPFALLGAHQNPDGRWWVRAFFPGAHAAAVVAADDGRVLIELALEHPDGVFAAIIPRLRKRFAYQLQVQWNDADPPVVVDDPYRFGPVLGEMDLWLLAEGTELRPYDKLGAHQRNMDGCDGTTFAVWAPHARRVAVVGDWNSWDERRHPMRLRPEAGVWEIFLPGVLPGERYKFALLDAHGQHRPWRADPYARQSELRPATASVIAATLPLPHAHPKKPSFNAPMTVYEVHLPSWRRVVDDGNRFLTWDELADTLPAYAVEQGFTHLELMPITEHPLDASWGYQPIGLYAPTARHGAPEGLVRFVDRCHAAGLGLILDWVPGHFPADDHGLAHFDGTHLYEHADPREGTHPDWKTLIYNFGRREVQDFLVGNARYWIERWGADGLRVDAVASMLYRDYSRAQGEWTPNVHGGRENLGAVAFVKRLNEELGASDPLALTIAEESTSWPGVSQPTSAGGLGFHYKWNMGWMNDTLRYMARDPAYRRFHQNELTFGLLYAFDEHFILPLSHDEVVHGKGSLLEKMPGDPWQKFANLRLYYAFMYAHPGKKLLFMGCEFAQVREWNHDGSLDWHLLADHAHLGIQSLVRDLNHLHRKLPALHELDTQREGFEWITHDDHDQSVLAFVRCGRSPHDRVVAVCNFTPVLRPDYRIGVPREGGWHECFNSDSAHYGGGDVGNLGARLTPDDVPAHGRPASLRLTLPPLSAIYLEWLP